MMMITMDMMVYGVGEINDLMVMMTSDKNNDFKMKLVVRGVINFIHPF